MSYGLKYIMQWASQNANANNYRIELYQKDYSGEVTEKKLGFAPSLVMDNAGNGIMGTSLRFSIQADTDGELNDLYTTDSKMYKVLLYRNETVVWNGYMLQELYSEEYIAPPYDVDVTATDQLALLKDEIYNPLGRVSLLRIIDNALLATQLDLGYAIQSSLKPEVQDSGTFLDYITVDDRGFADKTAYEVLEGVLSTLNMTICQQYNRWCLIRRNDVNAPIYIYGSDLGYLGQEEPVAAQIGQMYVNRIYPIGNLMLTKQAAKKGAKFNYTPILPLSILEDPNTVGKDKWNYNADYIRSYPAVEVNYRGSYIKAKVDAFTLVSTKQMVKDYALWQALDVEASEQALKLEVAYLGLVTAANNAFLPDPSVTVRLSVQIKVESDEQTYYLTQQGWSEEDAEDIVFTGNWLRNSIAAMANKDNYNTASIEFPGFPISGKFTISFRNDSTITAGHRPEENRVDLAVSNVYVTMPEIQGYNSNVLVNPNAAQMGPEQMLLFSDAYQVANESALNYNYILYPSGDVVSRWELAGRDYESFYQAMIQDISNSIGNVVNKFSGVIAGEGLLSPVYLEKFSSSVMRLEKGTYDLVQEELSGEWIEVPSNAVEVGEYEVLTNDGQRVSVGSATDSKVPTGNFASAAAFEQLTKIVNILNTIIGLDDDDNAYVKPKSDGTPRNFYTFGTMSFGGIDDGESGEGGGTSITSLYDIPEIAVSVATLADGQSLVYDATLRKWVNRLVQSSGGGLDVSQLENYLTTNNYLTANSSLDWDKLNNTPTTLEGYGVTDNVAYRQTWNDLIHDTNEFTFAKAQHTGVIWINFRTASGDTDGAISEYRFANGSGRVYTKIRAAQYIVNEGTSSQFLKADGSRDSTVYWHAGNDGSGSGLDADLLDGLDETRFFRRRSILNSYDSASALSLGLYMLGTAESVTDYFPTSNGTFINLTSTDNSGAVGTNYGLQFCANYAADALYVRSVWYNSLKSWKQLAFTDSNIAGNAASATKLQTSRKIWGQPFNGTADVTGSMYIPNASAIFWKDKEGNDINSLYLTSLNRLILGAGTHAKGISTYVGGFDFRIRFGENADTGLLMNSSGDILVGTVNAYTKTAKLLVKGDVQVADGDFWLASPSDVNINTPRLYLSSLLSDTKSYVFIQGINETAYGLKAIAFFTRDAANYTDEATEKMRISYNGNVGIGTTTPAYKLDVDGTIRGDIMFKTPRTIWGRTFDGTGNITSHLELGNSIAIKVTDTKTNTLRNALVMDSSNSLLIGSGNVASDAGYMTHIYGKPIIFSISSDNHPVTITSNANVLIGTTTENIAYKLNVVGAARISDTLNLGAGVQIGNNALVSFRSKVTETETEAKYYSGLYLSPANNFQIGYGTAITGKFKTNLHGYGIDFRSKGNDSATMSLTIGGNVGIGITNPEYKLDVNGTTRLNGKVTLTKDVVLNNYTAIKFKDFDGVELNTIMVGTDNAVTIGADHAVKNYETRIKGVGVTLFHGNTQVLSLTSTELITAKGITPFVGNTYDLGTASNRWQDIYCYNLDAATRIIMQVPGFTYPCAKIIRDTSTNKVYYQAGLVDGSARQGKMGISGIDATKLASLDINSTLTTISDKLEVNGRGVFNAGVGLAANQFIYTTNSAGGLLKTFGVQDEELLIGFETSTSAKYNTFIYGKNISFKYGGTTNVALTIDEEGNAIFHKYLQSSSDGTHLLDWYGEGRFWNLMPQTTKAHNLGSENKRWASAHINDVVAYNSVKIGDATLVWDAVNQCLVVDKNFVSDGSISFGGLEPPTEDNYLATNGGTILGDLGIGNAANTYKNLNMYGSMYFYLNSNPTAYKMQLWMDGNSRLALRNPTDHAATKFYVYGDIIYNGTSGKPSDMRLKYVVEDVCLSSEIIANAPLFKYKRKDSKDDRIYIGSSAQYWQGVAPELTPLVDDYLTLDYETLGVMMGKSNATEIELLKERMKILEAKVENYERILGII